jgi:hypothetical protein
LHSGFKFGICRGEDALDEVHRLLDLVFGDLLVDIGGTLDNYGMASQ